VKKQVWIVEDEPLARAHLERKLLQVKPHWQVVAALGSLDELQQALATAPLPDVLFCDIELSDGRSFAALPELPAHVPVIFVTAYQQFTDAAFAHNGVGYLLKPVSAQALLTCLNRVFAETSAVPNAYRQQFLVKKGDKFLPLQTADITHFTADTYVFAHAGTKQYALQTALKQLEGELDPGQFFRISRQHMVHRRYIAQIEPYLNGRLALTLTTGALLIVSRERAAPLKAWLEYGVQLG
jgi:two-component system, LytTR family, response regulator LytT